jgi:hypothetical protein
VLLEEGVESGEEVGEVIGARMVVEAKGGRGRSSITTFGYSGQLDVRIYCVRGATLIHASGHVGAVG